MSRKAISKVVITFNAAVVEVRLLRPPCSSPSLSMIDLHGPHTCRPKVARRPGALDFHVDTQCQPCLRVLSFTAIILTLDIPAELLPKWLLLVSAAAIFNCVQNILSIKLTQRIYSNQPQQGTQNPFVCWSNNSHGIELQDFCCVVIALGDRSYLRGL